MKALNVLRFVVCCLFALGLVLDSGMALAETKDVEPLGFEFALTVGASTGPFKTEPGFYIGGALDVPIWKSDPLFGQKLMGEIMVGWTRNTDDVVATSPIGVILPQFKDLVTTTGFEVTTTQVILGAKYKFDKLGEPESVLRRLQPYVVAGVGFNVMLGKTTGSPLGDLIGGVASQPKVIQERGFPAGQGNVLIGGNFGGGIDFFLTDRILIGAEFRWNATEDSRADFGTFGGKVGFMF